MVEIASFFWLDLPYTLKLIFQFYNIFIRTRITKTLTQQTHKLSANTQALSKHTSSQQTHKLSANTQINMAFNAAFAAIQTYADEQGITLPEALASIKEHPSFPKAKRGRPRKEQEPVVPSKRPRGRPPAGTEWNEDREMYLNSDGSEYVKVDTPPTTRRRGRPPAGTAWDNDLQCYVNADGSKYEKAVKVASTKPRGRPPAGKVWDEQTCAYIEA